jgi:hypothetical protein
MTKNGGIDWVVQNLFSPWYLHSVFFTNENTGYATGDGGSIISTENGGLSWNYELVCTLNDLSSCFFTDETSGYAVGRYGTIIKRTNGGVWIDEKQTDGVLNIYPNPAREKITITLPFKPDDIQSGCELSVSGITGIEVLSQKKMEKEIVINVNSLSPGLYLIRCVCRGGVVVGKFIKE